MQGNDTVATINISECLFVITSCSVNSTIPVVLATEGCIKLSIYWYAWSNAILYQMQGNDAVATISEVEGLNIITCLIINHTIPCVRRAECCSKLMITILTLWCRRCWRAINSQVKNLSQSATIYRLTGIDIITRFIINLTIPLIWFALDYTILYCIIFTDCICRNSKFTSSLYEYIYIILDTQFAHTLCCDSHFSLLVSCK